MSGLSNSEPLKNQSDCDAAPYLRFFLVRNEEAGDSNPLSSTIFSTDIERAKQFCRNTFGRYPPITAPALVIVGAIMLQHLAKIDWKDYTETIPAFLTLIGIPRSYSIADGLALGFISYPLIKLFSGRGREANWLTYVLAAVLVFYFAFVRSKMG